MPLRLPVPAKESAAIWYEVMVWFYLALPVQIWSEIFAALILC